MRVIPDKLEKNVKNQVQCTCQVDLKISTNILLLLLPVSLKIFFSWGFHGNSSNCLYDEVSSNYPAEEKTGKEKKKKRGAEERKQT